MEHVLVKEIMSTNLKSVDQYAPLSSVQQIIDNNNVHHVLVLDQDKLIGIISTADIERSKCGSSLFLNHSIQEQNETLLATILVASAMTAVVETISENATLHDAYLCFKKNSFRCLPVMAKGKLVGIITPMDFLDYYFT